MNAWEKVHGKILNVTELDNDGKIKITTDKSKLLVYVSKIRHWYNQLDLSLWPTYILGIISSVGWIIISLSIGLLLAIQIVKSIDYILSR